MACFDVEYDAISSASFRGEFRFSVTLGRTKWAERVGAIGDIIQWRITIIADPVPSRINYKT